MALQSGFPPFSPTLNLHLSSARCSLCRIMSRCATANPCTLTVLLFPLQPQSSRTGQELMARLHQLSAIKSNLPCQEHVNELQKQIPKFSEPLGCCLQSLQGTSLIHFQKQRFYCFLLACKPCFQGMKKKKISAFGNLKLTIPLCQVSSPKMARGTKRYYGHQLQCTIAEIKAKIH